MATSNWRPHHLLQTKKSLFIINLVTYIFHLLLVLTLSKVNAQSTETVLRFNFTRFVPNQRDLIFQGDAQASTAGVLQVTRTVNGRPVRGSTGRVLYSSPLQIWDRRTGRETSFTTRFSFVVRAPTHQTADGIAFFLAPTDSQIPLGSGGGFLGLFSDRFYNGSRRTVAVEFDTCFNINWDPPATPHIGIDVNSIRSLRTVPWNRRNGVIANVVISYKVLTKILMVTLTYPNSGIRHDVYEGIDLKSILPEYVRIGFSATTGLSADHLESHDVLSWSFSATRRTTATVEDDKSLRDAIDFRK